MFDAKKIKNDIIQWIRDWFEENGPGCNAVVGISGGKDSSVVAALCVEALGQDRVIGIKMPCGEQPDIIDATKLIKHLGIKSYTMNIWDAVISIDNQFPIDIEISKQTAINLPARIRMATLYAVSQSVNGRVANTCNLSEDWIGYSTRWGDSVGDFAPLARLTSDEVVVVGDACDLPYELTHKIPADGLCGKTDEDNFGFTYAVLNEYIRTGICNDKNVKEKIDEMHRKNLFKLMPIPTFEYKEN